MLEPSAIEKCSYGLHGRVDTSTFVRYCMLSRSSTIKQIGNDYFSDYLMPCMALSFASVDVWPLILRVGIEDMPYS